MVKEKLYIIKIGGNVIDDATALHTFLSDFAALQGKKILVHGGGKVATAIGEKLGIESKYVDGRRITDDETIDLVTMVYGGLVNKKIVGRLQSLNCNAIGVTGADAGLIPAVKRPFVKRAVVKIDYGWVGDLDEKKINTGAWQVMLDAGWRPVVAPLTYNNEGHILNTNADTIASVLAVALSDFYATSLVFCFEKDGVLEDVENVNSVIKEITPQRYRDLKDSGKLFSGIIPKIENALNALENGVKEVVIGNSAHLKELVAGNGGTRISK
ncbi:MAG: acetylglutamate kinase [Chitinophagaceae bacterium]|nr:acetylglutamate kinase [Chitinophagaceae bacterium]